MFAACKKEAGEQGYTSTTAYKNTLNVPVEILSGTVLETREGKDTIVFAKEGIKIKAGETVEYSHFVCLTNCPMVYYDAVANDYPVTPSAFSKMIVGSKEKIDTLCGYYYSLFPDDARLAICNVDAANLLNNAQWNETKDKAGNLIRREYVIDADDLAETK
ncbi:hypothetical protein [Niabella ginsengisoli]|uniref:Lipoprotein n=1 Tax=Niabella ginsengisoli TaxID=522298 RepID=A0ABS9SI71_9BACT|nr:hypothetical protein [Niabella ginsengisoli]MCH5598072.1 hypothetical protein [Niabella ginsengisoli]